MALCASDSQSLQRALGAHFPRDPAAARKFCSRIDSAIRCYRIAAHISGASEAGRRDRASIRRILRHANALHALLAGDDVVQNCLLHGFVMEYMERPRSPKIVHWDDVARPAQKRLKDCLKVLDSLRSLGPSLEKAGMLHAELPRRARGRPMGLRDAQVQLAFDCASALSSSGLAPSISKRRRYESSKQGPYPTLVRWALITSSIKTKRGAPLVGDVHRIASAGIHAFQQHAPPGRARRANLNRLAEEQLGVRVVTIEADDVASARPR